MNSSERANVSFQSLLAISKGGGDEETIEFAGQFKSVTHGKLIALTEPDSKLASMADIKLCIPKVPEIDEFDLAPTTSSSTSMAICDVLAICVQRQKGLTVSDFAQFHPSGTLGKRLLLQVRDLMVSGRDLPIVDTASSFAEVIYEMSAKGLGQAIITDKDNQYFGVITDGDIRRLLLRKKPVEQLNADQCFNLSRRDKEDTPVPEGWVSPETKAFECLTRMQDSQITSLVILESGSPVGLIRLQDLVAAGI